MKLVQLVAAGMAMVMSYSPSSAQWTQKRSFDSTGRMDAFSFSLGNKIYVGGGVNGSIAFQDFWEYDPATNIWTRKADIPFFGYNAAATFVIDNKGYFSTGDRGAAGFTPSAELYEYDPATDKWTQKAGLYSVSADDRAQAIGFAIGGKGYIGGGYRISISQGGGGSFASALYDIFEFNPQTNGWVYKTDIPLAAGTVTGRSSAIATTLGDYAYIGTGCNGDATTTYADFYRYHPATNNWDTLAALPGGIAEATAVTLGNYIYVIGGNEFPATEGTTTCRRYNTVTDKWETDIAFPYPITSAVAAVASNRIFMGTGTDDFLMGAPTNDWFEFVPSVVSVKDDIKSTAFSVYPNPAGEKISISLHANIDPATCKMVLYDILGKEVLASKLVSRSSDISLLDVSPGHYLCIVYDQNGERLGLQQITKQ